MFVFVIKMQLFCERLGFSTDVTNKAFLLSNLCPQIILNFIFNNGNVM